MPATETPIAIQVEDLHKSFRIPTHRIDSLKERVVRPFATRDYRELHALDGISFEIRQGEFFGIVGRNGSGKSTLLKLLASIYRADSGRILMAGRLAPFIELGVGFNHELTARENVVLNGVMMGLTPAETRRRLDAVLEFAELGEFSDLKLKNYSSGMLVRLAFSLMLEVDADILLIDEVLAVGDAAFQQKCADAFHTMKAAGKTIVLVTHQMASVEEFCHRAMLISDGRIEEIGDPADVGRRYLQLNFEAAGASTTAESEEVVLREAWLENGAGERVTSVEYGEEVTLRLELEAKRELPGAHVGFVVADADAASVFELGSYVGDPHDPPPVPAGGRFRLAARWRNELVPGRYYVHLGVNRHGGGVAMHAPGILDFVVYGPESRGVVIPKGTIEATLEEGE
ncbi:MAG TPA: ABC transporter ATP-binding protein [Solirubrobacterales bacterium]|nr:ABC transporter ATP-binding protein [Solirubrobacterales bacterium]